MNEQQRFGKLIEDGMKQRGLVGYQFAAMLEKPQSWLSRILNGQYANPPTPEDMAALSETLGIPKRRMLEALGYLGPEEQEPDIAHTVRDDDPRAALLDMLAEATDDEIRKVIQIVTILLGAVESNRQVDSGSAAMAGS
jgi:transcriptional regulator with XRE-family HTH domain